MIDMSKMNLDDLVKEITASEFGIVLVKPGDERTILDVLAEHSTWEDRQGLFGDGQRITVHLFPLRYNSSQNTMIDIRSRQFAIRNLFDRWTALGYNKHHAKKSYNSRAFHEFLDNLEFTKAKYMLVHVM